MLSLVKPFRNPKLKEVYPFARSPRLRDKNMEAKETKNG